MRIRDMHIGMEVRHPAYGAGTVVALTEQTADVAFADGGRRTVSPEGSALAPAEATAELSGLLVPLQQLLRDTAEAMADHLGLERPERSAGLISPRWRNGTLVLRPADASLQSKEVAMETFFHKIVMMRNQLRVLEQKINAHEGLSDAEKVEMQSYITRCYGSMTTFNVLFREKEDGF